MNTVYVYRLDEKTKQRIPLGILMERRKTERGGNAIGMLRMARKEFAESEAESRSIFIHYD
jgi:hypothetical protein